MALPFAEYLDLVERSGRHAVECFSRLSPKAELSPNPDLRLPAKVMVEALWMTLEMWAWAVGNPTLHWSQRAEPKAPAKYSDLLAALEMGLGRFTQLVGVADPAAPISSSLGSGSITDVARLVAAEVTSVAHSSGWAAGMPLSPLAPKVASDFIDQRLHLSQVPAGATVKSEVRIAALRCTDTCDVWYLALNGDWNFRLVPPTPGGAVLVESTALTLFLWLQGHQPPDGLVSFSGDARTLADLREVLALPPIESRKRRVPR